TGFSEELLLRRLNIGNFDFSGGTASPLSVDDEDIVPPHNAQPLTAASKIRAIRGIRDPDNSPANPVFSPHTKYISTPRSDPENSDSGNETKPRNLQKDHGSHESRE
ncbi:MAG: hypothetical protein Q7P63_12715, partial [Verrucomicrobiota bacterium JB022]|nr:hypothetical protein [Verrucomicrobiota bacterium JB022]